MGLDLTTLETHVDGYRTCSSIKHALSFYRVTGRPLGDVSHAVSLVYRTEHASVGVA